MRNSLARRISLHRPTARRDRGARAPGRRRRSTPTTPRARRRASSTSRRRSAARRRVAYIDPLDVRYNRFERVPKPITQAVMFCLMDVSGSMTEAMKDLAKRFFLLLHVFLSGATSMSTSSSSATPRTRRRWTRTRSSTAARPAAPSSRPRSRRCCAWCASATARTTGTSTRRRPRTATTTPRTATAAASSWATRSCRSPSISPISRWAPRRRCATASPRPPPICGAPTPRSPSSTRNFAMRAVADPTQIFPVFHELFAKQRAEG